MLEAPEKMYAPKSATRPSRLSASARAGQPDSAPKRLSRPPTLRRDTAEDFTRSETDAGGFPRPRGLRFSGLRFRLKSGVPRSMAGRIAAGVIVLGGLAGFTAVLWQARSMLLHDARLIIPSSSSIQITGNEHLTRPQLLSVFGDDVDRNILTVSLEDRKLQLEQLPWVEHATVMRLLPNKLRIAIVERTPVAYVRQGGQINLVDGSGVVLDISPDSPTRASYSFPIVTGISADEPLSTRAARMKLFHRFMTDLDDGSGPGLPKVSDTLSEVDLSSPEDVKALISSDGTEILVHFGDDDFLARYQRFKQRLPEWKTQYPKLASVDMRYERQVVLEMAPGAAVPRVSEPEASTPVIKAPAKKSSVKQAQPKQAQARQTPVTKAIAKPTPKAPQPAPHAAAKPASLRARPLSQRVEPQ